MKKHTLRIREKNFADDLQLGERFAISEASTLADIQDALHQRDLHAHQLRWSQLPPKDRHHFATFEVITYNPKFHKPIRRKHSRRISERAFAAALRQGERFGTSEDTTIGQIEVALNERGLRAVRVPLSDLGQNAARHYHVYDVEAL